LGVKAALEGNEQSDSLQSERKIKLAFNHYDSNVRDRGEFSKKEHTIAND
jgi:hypothetical protein